MIVVDASVVIKWLRVETDRDKAKEIQKAHLSKKNQIIIPRLLIYEVANALATKYPMTKKEIKESLGYIYKCDLVIHQEEEVDMVYAAVLARKYSTTVYDMLYAVIAKKHKTILVTADERFIQKTKFSYVKLLAKYKI